MSTATSSQPVAPSVFPDAPAGAANPESAGKIFRARVNEWLNANMFPWVLLWVAIQVVVPVGLSAAGYVGVALGVGFLSLCAAVVFLFVLWGKAKKAFWQAYATSRGLDYAEDSPSLPFSCPILTSGDKREVHRVLRGRIGSARAHLAEYTYTEITYTTDSDGHRQKQETDYDFVLLCWDLPDEVAARYKGVYLRKDTLSFGALQDKLAHDRAVELESAAFNKRYDLRVVDDQDDIALYELFSTIFVDLLAHDMFVQWEQVGHNLVCFRKGHTTDPAELDQLCAAGVKVYQRYIEEHQ